MQPQAGCRPRCLPRQAWPNANSRLEEGAANTMARMGTRAVRKLWTTDNLEGLSRLTAESVTLAYLDPPFNSGRSYDAIVSKSRSKGRDVSKTAFSDQWRWDEGAEETFRTLDEWLSPPSVDLIEGLVNSTGRGELAAYIVMMAPRLSAVARSLRDEGSMYVHCDPAASHYLKVLLDQVLGAENFRNEIIWKRTHAHSSSRRYGPVHDVILFYSKSSKYIWNPTYLDYQSSYIDTYFTHEDKRGRYQAITCTAPGDRIGTRAHYKWKGKYPPPGRHWAWKREQMEKFESEGRLVHSGNGIPRLKRYVDDGPGVALQDTWLDVNPLSAHSDERVGFETQKPVSLLERLIRASSNQGDLVIDPFCGSGTTLVAAERLKRQWIGMDSSFLATSIALSRVRQEVNLKKVALAGFPTGRAAALKLRTDEPLAFGLWGTGMLATIQDRRTFNGRLAAGSGRLKVRRRNLQLMSWVPLKNGPSKEVPDVPRGRLSKVGFVLCSDRDDNALHKSLKRQLEIPLHEVPLDDLVEESSRNRGLSHKLVEVTSGE